MNKRNNKIDLSKAIVTPFKVAKSIPLSDIKIFNKFINNINNTDDKEISKFIENLSDAQLIFFTCILKNIPVRLHAFITKEVMRREPHRVPAVK